MQYGLMTVEPPKQFFNAGDYIQGLAARQFLPEVDSFINRERLPAFSGPPTKMIMNGWYMHRPQNWPPSADTIPLFVSFHLTPKTADSFLDDAHVAYLEQYRVGARDHATLERFQAKGIDAYLSGCLILTLGHTYQH